MSAIVVVIGAVPIGLGSFMPWLVTYDNQGTYDFDGLSNDRDGIYTLILGSVALGIGIGRLCGPTLVAMWVQRLTPLLGLGAWWLSRVDTQYMKNFMADQIATGFYRADVGGYPGPGLTVIVVGAIAVGLGGSGLAPSLVQGWNWGTAPAEPGDERKNDRFLVWVLVVGVLGILAILAVFSAGWKP
jgi:hypothetical protein